MLGQSEHAWADKWSTWLVTAYYNRVLGELTAYDEMEVCNEILP